MCSFLPGNDPQIESMAVSSIKNGNTPKSQSQTGNHQKDNQPMQTISAVCNQYVRKLEATQSVVVQNPYAKNTIFEGNIAHSAGTFQTLNTLMGMFPISSHNVVRGIFHYSLPLSIYFQNTRFSR